MRLTAHHVNQIAIQSEREHGGDAVSHILVELRRHVFGRVIFRARPGSARDAEVPVRVDQSGYDVLPSAIDHARAAFQRQIDSLDARARNLQRCLMEDTPRAIDDVGMLEHDGWRLLRQKREGQEEESSRAHAYNVSIRDARSL